MPSMTAIKRARLWSGERALEILTRELGGNGTPSTNEGVEPALKTLVQAANEAGGYDNITAVLVTIGAPAE